jgi:hypothetical protein
MAHLENTEKDVNTSDLLYVTEYESTPLKAIKEFARLVSKARKQLSNLPGPFTQSHKINVCILALKAPVRRAGATQTNCHAPSSRSIVSCFSASSIIH